MKRILHKALHTALLLTMTCLLFACGNGGNSFKIKGQIKNLDQAEFYVYSLDGSTVGIDTVKVNKGKFTKTIQCLDNGIAMIVFPNFSELPLFTKKGATLEIEGDASKMKETTVNGTDDNELMTDFRKQILNMSPPEIKKQAELFINDHLKSSICPWIVRKYFITDPMPDTKKALELINAILDKQPDNALAGKLKLYLEAENGSMKGSRLPAFTATCIDSTAFNSSTLTGSIPAIISTWSTWNYKSLFQQGELRKLRREKGGNLKLLSIAVDADKQKVRTTMKQDTIDWSVICDGQLFESPVMKKLSLNDIPQFIIVENGKVTLRTNDLSQVRNQINK